MDHYSPRGDRVTHTGTRLVFLLVGVQGEGGEPLEAEREHTLPARFAFEIVASGRGRIVAQSPAIEQRDPEPEHQPPPEVVHGDPVPAQRGGRRAR